MNFEQFSRQPNIADGAMVTVVPIVAGVYGFGAYNAPFTLGIAHTSAFSTASGDIFSAIALGEVFSPLKIAGALMVLSGTTLVRVLGRGLVIPTPEPNAAPLAAMSVAVIRSGN
ncbi:MAG: hypothetical protein H0V00_03885 [Chloroflexia bacterium]|nr:hypothetical protein [Chloroflexia bacterium]